MTPYGGGGEGGGGEGTGGGGERTGSGGGGEKIGWQGLSQDEHIVQAIWSLVMAVMAVAEREGAGREAEMREKMRSERAAAMVWG